MNVEKRPPIGSSEYNDEPVYFCIHCLSLAIKNMGLIDVCMDCNSSAIAKTSLENYDKLYKTKYGEKKFYK